MKNCKIVSCGKKTAVMALAVSVGAMLMTGCSTSASASGSTASAGKPVVTVWAGGSDNVRVQFEKQIQQFNASQDQYTAELQFITSGTGAQGLFERVVAAKKAGQTDTDYDVIELGGDEVTKYVDEGGEDFFVPLDKKRWKIRLRQRRSFTSGSRNIRAVSPTIPRPPAVQAAPL